MEKIMFYETVDLSNGSTIIARVTVTKRTKHNIYIDQGKTAVIMGNPKHYISSRLTYDNLSIFNIFDTLEDAFANAILRRINKIKHWERRIVDEKSAIAHLEYRKNQYQEEMQKINA